MIFNNPMFVEKIYYRTLDEMKEFCSARSKDPEESPQAKVLYDQLKDYPSALQTHIIWEGIFSLMKTFKISREVEIKKIYRQKVVYLPKTETYNFTFLISLKLDLAGKGTSRKVKKWYDLESKSMVAAKKFDKYELALLNGFRGNRGIESPLKYYHCQSVKNKNKIKVIEELYDGTLKNDNKLDVNELKVVFADVLNGLKVFHQGAFECEYSENKLNNFHQDIKLDNIVFKVDQSNKIVKACLIDFGSACKIKRILGSPLFFSPEKAAAWIWTLEQKKLARQVPNNALMSHFEKYGQANDLWTLGLVFATILFARGRHGLNLHRNYQCNSPYYQMDLIINAKQESIDGELRNGRDSQSKDRAVFWDIVQGLLKVNPSERLTAHQALELLNRE